MTQTCVLNNRTIHQFIGMLALTGIITTALAQEVSIPDPGLDAAVRTALQKPTGPLTETDLLGLTSLNAGNRNITNAAGLDAARNLGALLLYNNHLASYSLPAGLTNLAFLDLSGNQLTNVTLPAGLTQLTQLELYANQLRNLTLPAGMTNLVGLDLFDNQLTNLLLPAELKMLVTLDLHGNQFTRFDVPSGLAGLSQLNLGGNQLTEVTLAAGMTNLNFLFLNDNQLTNASLPAGLTKLSFLRLDGNQLTNLTLPPDVTLLSGLFLDGNPLTVFVLSEPLAATGMATTVTNLQNQGIPVFTYPLTVQLVFPRQQPIGAFRFGITGPPGVYTVYSSSNLTSWEAVNFVNNPLGSIFFTDTEAHLSPQKFYRAVRQIPPTNMVFIPANTFTMGSPTNDLDASANERPPTTVLLTHGYWIGKFEVTQGEYLSIMNTNPSEFPGDLRRPVSSMSWFDATNYCAKLTERELVAGRIPPGSHYRLPTEAEWECAARAGTTTRFSHGDDPNYDSLTNYAWFLEDLAHPDLIVHPVGQKLPNLWGLYDMYGNVWEWCQDWYGDLPGGAVTDPTGPTSNPFSSKVMRGGAYDYPNSSCRSASRLFQSHDDSDLGFRVVLVRGS
jgi:formylglycine-generating enzyme required for sulfatase activity